MKWRLAACRVQARMTQKEVAKALGISEVALVSYEKGRTAISMEKAQNLSDIYGIPLELMDFSRLGNREVD